MAKKLSPSPILQFFVNGVPASGYKLFTYTAGTTTKATTWSDNAGSTANSNPIILNSNGNPLNSGGTAITQVFISGNMKFVLAPSNDTDPPTSPVWTADNIVGLEDLDLSPYLAAGSATQLNVITGSTLNIVDNSALKIAGTAITATATELNKLAGVTAGTTTASKALVVDANKALDTATIGNLQLVTNTITATNTNGSITLTPNGSGQVNVSSAINAAQGASIASAATTNLASATGNFITITGTTTITALGTVGAGAVRTVQFAGILTLTHNSVSLILPTAANITTAVGDVAEFTSLGAGNWQCTKYQRASGAALSVVTITDNLVLAQNSVDTTKQLKLDLSAISTTTTRTLSLPNFNQNFWTVQQVRAITGAVATGTTVLPVDDTIPQNTEGDQYLTLSITPKNASNMLVIECVFNYAGSVSSSPGMALFQDSTANALAAVWDSITGTSTASKLILTYYMPAGTTSATTFKIRAGLNTAGTLTFNGGSSARIFGGVMASSLIITEYSA